jgi:hypothetical protein
MPEEKTLSRNYPLRICSANWFFVFLLVNFFVLLLVFFSDMLLHHRFIFGGIILALTAISALVNFYSVKVNEVQEYKERSATEEKEALIEDFTKTVSEYRQIIIDNFYANVGEEKSSLLVEHKMIELFTLSAVELRAKFLYLLITIMFHPIDDGGEKVKFYELSNKLKGIALEKYDAFSRV